MKSLVISGKKVNKPCYCGSGNKYKKCCMRKDQDEVRESRKPKPLTLEEEARARHKMAAMNAIIGAIGAKSTYTIHPTDYKGD